MAKSKSGRKLWFNAIRNIPKWAHLSDLAKTAGDIKDTGKRFFTIDKNVEAETFEDAMKRLGLTEEKLNHRKKAFYTVFLTCLVFSVLLMGYFAYLLLYIGTIYSIILTFVLICVCFGMTFKYHFWYFQIKQRRLGCTFKEWLYFGVFNLK